MWALFGCVTNGNLTRGREWHRPEACVAPATTSQLLGRLESSTVYNLFLNYSFFQSFYIYPKELFEFLTEQSHSRDFGIENDMNLTTYTNLTFVCQRNY